MFLQVLGGIVPDVEKPDPGSISGQGEEKGGLWLRSLNRILQISG